MKQLLAAVATSVVLFACQSRADNAAAIQSARKAAIDSMNTVNQVNIARQHVIDSMKAVNAKASRAGRNVSSGGNDVAAAPVNNTTATPAPAKKKGWSHTAKGAVVGAGAGAITGAIVNKDRLKGAAIGTIIGAGVGAGTGAIVDHQKKKKQSAQ
ncbi:glycine zipper domain-containing protein [Chitinophaga barathri]|uniref:Glycine zipper family protein n=1 Tax=Chitinophaga barathri TaxID=1647451 RepID=A0A3N4MDS9_9BACT|nr:YMGG-like glycine zipper-containing protein [Chitinophaga barathri]RPD41738.1 glycine zipper family protein [Chitinophaga barathri]